MLDGTYLGRYAFSQTSSGRGPDVCLAISIGRITCYRSKTVTNCQLLAGIQQLTVPQLSIMVIYNSTWSILIQWIMDILSGDNLT